jgi:hypothetical protein
LLAQERSRGTRAFFFLWCGLSGGALRGKRKRKKSIIIPGDGDPCPRCGKPMQIRAYGDVVDEQLRAAFFYTRWFCCMNKQ